MAVADSEVTDRYAIYNGDCVEVIREIKDRSVHVSIYSPPFAELYNYSSSEHDMSNCATYEEFLKHYGFLVVELARVTIPGRASCVHCMDLRRPGGRTGVRDFPGDIIRMYEAAGFWYVGRNVIWKEPLRAAIKTRALGLRHGQLVKDSSKCHVAGADYLLVFRRSGENQEPITHPNGLSYYAGSRQIPPELMSYRGWTGNQIENRYSHWIWRQYASAFWDDVRVGNVLPYLESRGEEDEKHVHPLQLDVIDRAIVLWSNPGDTVLTPFMGVGSEVYGAVGAGRRGIGIELKATYFNQARKNLETVNDEKMFEEPLFDMAES